MNESSVRAYRLPPRPAKWPHPFQDLRRPSSRLRRSSRLVQYVGLMRLSLPIFLRSVFATVWRLFETVPGPQSISGRRPSIPATRGTFAELFPVPNYLFSKHLFSASAVQVLVMVKLSEFDSPRPH